MQRLDGKVALITGGATGIGLAAALSLACRGVVPVIFGPDDRALAAAVRSLADAGTTAYPIQGDVSDDSDVRELIAGAVARFGRVDFVINCAAIQPYGTVVSMGQLAWDRVMAVNVRGIYLTGHHAIPVIKAGGGGVIVNIASVQGVACQTNVAAYVASKGAVLALTRAMAMDHARDGIRVNAVCPGSIDTPMLRFAANENRRDSTAEALMAKWARAHPLGRVGRADEVGAMISFLCGPESSFCTGAEFKVDGGLLAQLGVMLPDTAENL